MLILTSYDHVMNLVFNNINSGKFFDSKLKLYSKRYLDIVLKYFENKEQYEKCEIIKNIIFKRFDHKMNYINSL